MKRSAKRPGPRLGMLLVVLFWLPPARTELATVRLTDGTVMRGDVELTESEAIIRNQAGEARCRRERIDRIDWLEPAKTFEHDYLRRLWGLEPEGVEGHFALAQWLVEQKAFELARQQCQTVLELDPQHRNGQLLLQLIEQKLAEATEPGPKNEGQGEPAKAAGPSLAYEGVQPPPPLAPRDILKLKLSELRLDGPAERLNVQFRRQRSERDVESLVRQEMSEALDYDPDWQRVLERGQPHEKLQVILKATGLKYADRIELRGHPQVFSEYRRRVLPLVTKGCVRSGCHGGHTAYVFRFPGGPQSSDEFVYTSFLLLDGMGTPLGPMIDRALPEESALLRYLLPAEEGRQVHPLTEHGRLMPVLSSRRDPRYQAIIEWIASLRSPHPDYQLDYQLPDWFEPLAKLRREPLLADEEPAKAEPATQPAEAPPRQPPPASQPADDQKQPDDSGPDQQP